MKHLRDFPLKMLIDDRAESLVDAGLCELALLHGQTGYGAGESVQDRLHVNQRIIAVIDRELAGRGVPVEPRPVLFHVITDSPLRSPRRALCQPTRYPTPAGHSNDDLIDKVRRWRAVGSILYVIYPMYLLPAVTLPPAEEAPEK